MMSEHAAVQPKPTRTSQQVLDLLREQAALYKRLDVLAGKQREMVAQDDAGPLAAVLAARQEVIEALFRQGEVLDSVGRVWADFCTGLSSDERRDAEELRQQVSRRLSRINQRDKEDARLLAARKQIVADMLRSTHVTKRALSAYRAPRRTTAHVVHVDEAS